MKKFASLPLKQKVRIVVVIILVGICQYFFLSNPAVVETLGKLLNNPHLLRTADEMKSYKWRKESALNELKLAKELDEVKADFEKWLADVDSLDKERAIRKNQASIAGIARKYSFAQEDIKLFKNGKYRNSQGVSEAIAYIQRIRQQIEKSIADTCRKREYMSTAERNKERAMLLADVLMSSGGCFEYIIDSMGFNRRNDGSLTMLTINGYQRFVPERFNNNAYKYLKWLGLEKQKKSEHDFSVFIVKSDKLDGEKYYGRKADFDMPELYRGCGIINRDGMVCGYYAMISFGFASSYKILCNRVVLSAVNGCPSLIVDLRPQKWCKWTLQANVERYMAERLAQNPGAIKFHQPHYSNAYKPGTLPSKHLDIEKVLKRKQFAHLENEAVGPIPHVLEILDTTMNDVYALGVEYDHSLKDYRTAYEFYEKAARMGSEPAAVNCAILLASFKVYTAQRRMNYAAAEKKLLPIIDNMKNKVARGYAYNILGFIYLNGGYGVQKDIAKARAYLQKGAAEGNTQAKTNLEDLNKRYPETPRNYSNPARKYSIPPRLQRSSRQY